MAKFIDVKFKVNSSKLLSRTRRQKKMLKDLPRRALKKFIEETPIDKGYARRQTRLREGNTIHADYAYADKLDNGHSKQSPQGMTKPTEDWLIKEFTRIFKR
jgi:hypothetical protein